MVTKIWLSLALLLVSIIWLLTAENVLPARSEHALKKTDNLKAQVQEQLLSKLGKEIFFDKNLSNPPGVGCVSCHDPSSGYSGSSDSQVLAVYGVMPGAVSGRFTNRKPPSLTYAKFCPDGPPFYDREAGSYFGGFFLDGRANNLDSQFHFPLVHPNEMNNVNNKVPAPKLVVEKVRASSYSSLVKDIYGANIFSQTPEEIILKLAKAVTAFESSDELSPFSSKYDAYLDGKAKLTSEELNGLQLITGSQTGRPGGPPTFKDAQCVLCHSIQAEPIVSGITGVPITNTKDIWTTYSYENVGVPKNLNNPYYKLTDKNTNPFGYNPLGPQYIDFGLGDVIYPSQGLPPGNTGGGSNGKGDYLHINGRFKVPSLRNVDKRPNEHFVKAYMHNGYFKSLKELVHFYNTRNLTTIPGEIIDFTKSDPYAALKGKPLWPPPENLTALTLQNPEGLPGQIGNLELSEKEEKDIVSFLKTLSDGYTAH